MDKDLQHELEKYKILYTAYADEIGNLWKRSIFLATFMTLAWGGYGALQLKILDKSCETSAHCHLISLGLCLIIIVLSLLWVAMAKGSKFVQEAHEKHIENFIENDKDLKKLYCNLKDYEYLNLSDNLFCFGILERHRYSPSKINIALGWISILVATVLMTIHILILLFSITPQCNISISVLIVALLICALIEIASIFYIFYRLKDYLKGGNK